MNKLGIIVISITVLMLIGGAFFLTKPQKPVEIPQRESGVYEYFWGNGCPHCAKVQEFFDTWDKYESVNINKREVWYNKENGVIMEDRFSKCTEIPSTSQMSVPFLVTPDGKCLVGDTPIIELFKNL